MGSVASAQVTGAFLVERGVISAAQLEEALEHRRAHGGLLDEILVDRLGLEREALAGAPLDDGARDIVEIILDRRPLDQDKLDEATARHAETGQPIGPILVDLGAITRLELASALAEQWEDRPAQILPTASGRGPMGIEAPAGPDSDELRFAMRALEASVRAASGQADDSAALEELRARERVLAERIEALEQSLASANSLELVGELGARLGAIEARLAAAPELDDDDGASGLDEALADAATLRTAFDELSGRLDAAASADGVQAALSDVSEELGSLGERVVGLASMVDQLSSTPQSDPEFTGRLEELARRVEAVTVLAEASSGVEGLQDALEGLTGRIDAVSGAVDGVARLDEGLDELRSAYAELSDRPITDPELAHRVDELSSLVSALVEGPQPVQETLTDIHERLQVAIGAAGRIDALDAAIGDLRGAIEGLAIQTTADPALAERLDTLAGRVESIAGGAAASTDADLAALSAKIEAFGNDQEVTGERVEALRMRIEELRGSIDELASRPVGDPDLALSVSETLRAVESLASRVDRVEGSAPVDLSSEMIELRAALQELAERPAADRMAEDLRSQIEETARAADERAAAMLDRLDRVESAIVADVAGGDESLRGEVTGLAEALTEVRKTLASELAQLAETWAAERAALQERVDELTASTAGGTGEGGAVPSSAPAAPELAKMAKEVERLGDRVVEQERSLVEHFSRREKAMMERLGMGGAGDLAQRVDQLTRLVEDQWARLERVSGGGGSAASGEDLVELKESLFTRIERLASSLDWRFQRLEGGPVSPSEGADLAARVDRLTRMVESIAPAGTAAKNGRKKKTGPSYLVLVPTAAGHQLVELEGKTPAAGDTIPSPVGEGELAVMGVGTSPLPGDERDCVFAELVDAPAPAPA